MGVTVSRGDSPGPSAGGEATGEGVGVVGAFGVRILFASEQIAGDLKGRNLPDMARLSLPQRFDMAAQPPSSCWFLVISYNRLLTRQQGRQSARKKSYRCSVFRLY